MNSLPLPGGENNPFLQSALKYAARGWCVFRLAQGQKVPLKDSHGFKDATADVHTIRRWWLETPTANIGIATGKVSGVFVVDADLHKAGGQESLNRIKKQIPTTYTTKTAREGRHFYFQTPKDRRIASGENKLGTWIDVKGEGGYVVAPPSKFEGGSYKIVNAMDPVPAPEWLIEELCSPDADREADGTEELMSSPGLCFSASPSLCLAICSISEAVSLSLPLSVHDNHRCLFRLARALKALELHTRLLTSGQKLEAFDSWYRQTGERGFLRQKQSRDEYLAEFFHALRKAKVPLGLSPAEQAWQLATMEPLPIEAGLFEMDPAKRIVALCFQLSRLGDGGVFYLAGREAARLTGQTHSFTSKVLSALVSFGVLEIAESNTTVRATRYRYKRS